MRGSTPLPAPKWRGREAWKPWLMGAGILIALQFVLFGLLVAGQAVPDKPIVDNLVSSIQRGTYGPSSIPDRMGTTSDSFTECVVVGTGLGADPAESALSRAARMPRIDNCDGGVKDITDVAHGKVFQDNNYYKYWAGYTVLTRPLLALVGLEGLRILSGVMLVAALFGAFVTTRARTSTAVATSLLLPFVAGTNMLSTPSTSFSQSIAMAFIFLSVILTAAGTKHSVYRGLLGVLVGAALFCYVDLLTTPAVPWAMSAFVLAAAVRYRGGSLARTALWGVAAAAVWPVGFGVTWLARWVFGAVFLGIRSTVAMVRKNVEFRTHGTFNGVSEDFGAGVAKNVHYWWTMVPTAHWVLTGCVLASLIGLALAVRRGGVARLSVAAVLALPAVIPAVWYTALSNHSQIHAFFVNRGVPTALGVLTAACWVAAALPRRDPRRGNGRRSPEQRGTPEPAAEREQVSGGQLRAAELSCGAPQGSHPYSSSGRPGVP